MAERVAARHLRRTAGRHSRQFQALVQVVDEYEDAAKALQRKGKRALQDLKDAIATDPEFALNNDKSGGDLFYGLMQQIQDMEKAMESASDSGGELGHAYDEFNRWALKWMK